MPYLLSADQLPHVLALTASIVTSKIKDLAEFIKEKSKLEEILDSEVITTEDLADLLKFATQPDESTLTYGIIPALPEESRLIAEGIEELQKITDQQINKIKQFELNMDLDRIQAKISMKYTDGQSKKFTRILAQTEKVLSDLGLFNGREYVENAEKEVKEVLLVKANDPFKAKLALKIGETLTKLRHSIERKLAPLSRMGPVSQFDTFSTDKVRQLLRILAQDEDIVDMTAIVFVQERTMAVALASLLIRIAEMQYDEFGHLRVSTLFKSLFVGN